MTANLIILVLAPIAAGLALLAPAGGTLRKNAAAAVFAAGLVMSVVSFFARPGTLSFVLVEGFPLVLGFNLIAAYVMVFVNLFGLLVCFYAREDGVRDRLFFPCLLMLVGFANLAVLAADFLLFAFGWGGMLALLYALLLPGSASTARKAASVAGTADFLLLGGIALYVMLSGTTMMPSSGGGLEIEGAAGYAAFLMLFAGAAGKAGAWPFHTWIPDASLTSPVSVMAALPASLDKLLGIYLLARVCADLFTLNTAVMSVMLLVGGFTIISAVLMALVQKDARRLLSYHAVSQVGYMIMGFGTGLAVGFAAGLFHMLNHAIYKTGLFMSAGAAGRERGTFNIGGMGGLARYMPATFACALIFSLSISGVPPLNGFYSKWMVYQGVISGLFAYEGAWIRTVLAAALILAMFGSALTLASFVKFLHSVFLGQNPRPAETPRETGRSARYPLMILAALCVLLGVFPRLFLATASEWLAEAPEAAGEWNALAAFLLLAAGAAGGIFAAFGRLMKGRIRVSGAYFGGQEKDGDMNFPATEFYRTVEELPFARRFYGRMDSGLADIYGFLLAGLGGAGALLYRGVDRMLDMLTSAAGAAVLAVSRVLRKAHTGNLDLYVLWSLLALAALFFAIMR